MHARMGDRPRSSHIVVLVAAAALTLSGSSGCQSPRHQEIINDVRVETRLLSSEVYDRHCALLRAEGPPIVPALIAELERENASGADSDSANRILLYLEVLRQLRARGAKEVVEEILARTQDWDIQFDALETLDVVGDRGSCAAIRTALTSTDPWVRAIAARLLGLYWCDESIPELIALLEDNYEAPALQAERSLGRLTGEWLGRDPEPWRQWYRSLPNRRPAQ